MPAIIATRRYYVTPPAEAPDLIVSIERPFQSETGYYQCNYHFSGLKEVSRYSKGADEFDALITTLAMAGTDLHFLNETSYGGLLRWDGGPVESSLPTIRDHWPFNKQFTETT